MALRRRGFHPKDIYISPFVTMRQLEFSFSSVNPPEIVEGYVMTLNLAAAWKLSAENTMLTITFQSSCVWARRESS